MNSKGIPQRRPAQTAARPPRTVHDDQTSIRKCSASASRAWLPVALAVLARAWDRETSTTMEPIITANAIQLGAISTGFPTSRSIAS